MHCVWRYLVIVQGIAWTVAWQRSFSPRFTHVNREVQRFQFQRWQSTIHTTFADQGEKTDFDVTVLGGGPAGMAIAWLLQEKHQLKVAIIDPRGDKETTWYPNYGEWQDEWHSLAERLSLPQLKSCTTNEWDVTDCFFGGTGDVPMNQCTRLPRPYIRIDRVKMQKLLRSRFLAAKGHIISSKVSAKRIGPNLFDQNIVHHAQGTRVVLDNKVTLETKVVIDSTGFESRFIEKEVPHLARGKDERIEEGYQIAYGFIAHCSSTGPYDFNAMTLFDYRTDFLAENKTWLADAVKRPTFMYVMPLGKNDDGTYRIFWEETSLVGKGKRRLSFAECKARAMQRLAFYNITVSKVEEEEYCYIPMGGELPDLKQRIIAFGGAANMVHPATGYHVCRMLAASTDLASSIASSLAASAAPSSKYNPDKLAIHAYQSIWGPRNRLQRDFQAFGGDFLMLQDVNKLRGFFSAFFALEQPMWSGFLGGWPGLPNNQFHDRWDKRLQFGLNIFVRMPFDVASALVVYAIAYTLKFGPNTLLRSVLPPILFGEGPAPLDYPAIYESTLVGDTNAKQEARTMIQAFEAEKLLEESNDRTLVDNVETILVYPAPYDGE